MLFEEFLQITNLSEDDVVPSTYKNVIEPMYMGSNLSKEEFAALIDKEALIEKYPNVAKIKRKIASAMKASKKNAKSENYSSEKRYELENEIRSLVKEMCEFANSVYHNPMRFSGLDIDNSGNPYVVGFRTISDSVLFGLDWKIKKNELVN